MSFLRRCLKRIPLVAYSYQRWRQRQYDEVRDTPYGFRLGGLPAALATAEFERHEIDLVRRLLSRVELFIDIGAHVGLYTCLARQAGRPAIAVEASPHTARRLLYNLRMNDWNDTEVFPVALGGRAGAATLFGTGTGASLLPGWAGAGSNEYLDSLVPVHRADDLLLPRLGGRKALVKMDVEGAELEVLRGARSLLGANPAPLWLVEICLTENQPDGTNPAYEETFRAFFEAGYDAWAVAEPLLPVAKEAPGAWAREGRTPHGLHNYLFAREPV